MFTLVSFLLATIASALADDSLIQRRLELKDTLSVAAPVVCVTDLFSEGWLQMRCPKEKAQCCPWKMPAGSTSVVIDRAQIEKTINSLALAASPVTVTGAPKVTAMQTHRELTVEEIKQKILNKLSVSPVAAEADFKVEDLRIQAPLIVKLDEANWNVAVPDELSQVMTLQVQIVSSSGASFLGWVRVKLKLEDEVFVAKRTIRSGEVLSSNDFELRKADLLAESRIGVQNAAVVRKFEFPGTMRARSVINSGSVLSFAAIERTPLVHLGEAVTLVLRSENLRISTKGVAQGSAAPGDMISVQLRAYGRTFRGKLNDNKSVEVWL